jgi:hypothetical protein
MTRALQLAMVLAVACTVERDVLVDSPRVTTCAAALAATTGEPCAFEGTCMQASPTNALCCSDTAVCQADAVVADHTCKPECSPCTDDSQCPFGAAICTGTACEACPSTSTCPVCPLQWKRLERNGCPTCDCGPPTTCNATSLACSGATSMCYPGARCTPGCVANDPGCCTSECAAPGCGLAGPAPVGCLATCTGPQTASGCNTCAADHCDCVSGAWHCTPTCANGTQASCIAPP